jgi:hypothetical protein
MKTQKSLDGTFWLREMMLENVSGGGKETLKITVKASELRGGRKLAVQRKIKALFTMGHRANWLYQPHQLVRMVSPVNQCSDARQTKKCSN